jgi:hypothetical protein
MTTLNSYATIADYKAYKTSRGQNASVDVFDDSVIELLLKSASRYIDSKTGRHFNPYIETRYFSVPGSDCSDPRVLTLDDDLLEVIGITNGDGVTIPSTEYTFRPRNTSPHYGIRLIDNSTYYWATDGAGDSHDVIAVNAIWGYHDHYSQAWQLATTAAEAMDATETGYDVTSGASFAVGNIIRFDNELGYVSQISTNTLTITRGENNSTAATHLTAINIHIWQPMEETRSAVCEIANNAYRRRFGESSGGTATVTAAGVVISPRDVPAMAAEFIATYRQIT